MADDFDLNSAMDDFDASRAGANVNGAYDVSAGDAVSAFQSASRTGIAPSAGMVDPKPLAQQAQTITDEDILNNSPAIQKFASRSPAHVAATKDDWPQMAKVGWLAQRFNDIVAPGKEWLDNYKRLNELGKTSAGAGREDPFSLLPKKPEGGEKELLQRTEGTGIFATLTAGLNTFTNVLAAPAARGYIGAVGPAAGQTREEAIAQVTAGLNMAAQVIGPSAIYGASRIKISVRPGIKDLGTATDVNAPKKLSGPKESVPDAEFEPVKPPGVSPKDNETYLGVAEHDAQQATLLQEGIAETKTHSQLPALTSEFLKDTAVAERSVWVDPQTLAKLYAEGHTPLAAYAPQISEALNSGRDLEIPAADYHAEVAGKSYAEELNATTRFREDGVSVEQAKELKPSEAETPTETAAEGGVEEGAAPVPRERVIPEDIPPETHEFVRTLAAKADIVSDEIFSELGLDKLFDPKALKLSKSRLESYDSQLADAKFALTEKILAKTYSQIRKERAPEWKDRLARHRADVEQAVIANRAVAARQELQYSEGPLGEPLERPGLKFDRSSLGEDYGKGVVDNLPRTMFSSEGLSADEVAPLLGYASGEELLADLLDLEAMRVSEGHASSKAHLKAMIDTEATRLARDELGYDISPEGLRQAALESAVLPQIEDFLEAGLKDTAETLGLPFDKEQLKYVAQTQFDQLPMKTATNLKTFEKGMWRTGEAAAKALEKGDFPAAFIARQQQLLNFYQLESAHFFRTQLTSTNKKFKGWAKKPVIRGMSQAYLDRIHEYLSELGYRVNRNPAELAEALAGKSLEDFVDEVIQTNPSFPEIPDVAPQTLETMKVEEYQQVRAFVLALARWGREEQTLYTVEGRRVLDEMIEAQIAVAPPSLKQRPFRVGGYMKPMEQAMLAARKYDAWHRKVADLGEWLDQSEFGGPFSQAVEQTLSSAADKEHLLRRTTYGPVADAFHAIPKETRAQWKRLMSDSPLAVPGREIEVRRGDLLGVALYFGQESAIVKAAEGYGTTPEVLKAWTNSHLTEAEVNFIQTVWDQFEALSGDVSTELRALTGTGLKRESALSWETPFGTKKGGYWPIQYAKELDPEWARREAEREVQLGPDAVMQLLNRIAPGKGFAEERTSYVGPVELSISRLSRVFDEHIKYAAYARAVTSARRYINDPRFRELMRTRLGEEYWAILNPWLDSIVMDFVVSDRGVAGLERIAMISRANMSAATMGLSVTSGISQAAGSLQAMSLLGEGPLAMISGAAKFSKGLVDAMGIIATGRLDELFASDEFLAGRYANVIPEFEEALNQVHELNPYAQQFNETAAKWRDVTMKFIGWAEFLSAGLPGYLAFKTKAIQELGMSEGDAIRYAGKMLRKSQGSSRKVDLAAVQRGSQFQRFFMMFASWRNQAYQLGIDVFREGKKGNFGNAVSRGSALWFLAPLAALYLTGRLYDEGDDPEDVFKNAGLSLFFNFFQPMMFAGDAATMASRNLKFENAKLKAKRYTEWDFSANPISNAFEKWARGGLAAADVTTGAKSYHPTQRIIEAFGPFGLAGANQIGKTAEYWAEVESGEQRPSSAIDYVAGTAFGPRKDQAVKQRRSRSRR